VVTFAGDSVRTARWRDIDLAGKRAAVIGVGAAGIQVIASIADRADHLTVFQRQAHWVSPNRLGDGMVSNRVVPERARDAALTI
jgi:4-hydroxyacetophenone monooxygenase